MIRVDTLYCIFNKLNEQTEFDEKVTMGMQRYDGKQDS